ncbi:hypothetical protein ABZ714_34390 [Streptomyces sp. NPDC006798]|uniref:hypothetical protein n=1 Tax=Streptomyces sp. NPDC006798 TaxID=3155462 RepID=UPI003404EB86
MTTPAPAVGQIWQDNDPRNPGRYLRIVEINTAVSRAWCRPVAYNPATGAVADLPGTRATGIRLDRLKPTSTGYRYIQDQP